MFCSTFVLEVYTNENKFKISCQLLDFMKYWFLVFVWHCEKMTDHLTFYIFTFFLTFDSCHMWVFPPMLLTYANLRIQLRNK